METDASDYAVGACLLQTGEDGRLHPVAYSSKKLDAAERNYPIHEKELLAIKEALRVWRHYLENGKQIVILTDHESLKYMKTIKRPSRRLVRWIEEFQSWDLDIRFRKGSEVTVPDALSRRPDYNPLRLNIMRGLVPNEEYAMFMETYLKENVLPGNEFDELVHVEAPYFALDADG